MVWGSKSIFLRKSSCCYRICSMTTTNTKDFCNLIDVYLDAIFYPKYVNDL